MASLRRIAPAFPTRNLQAALEHYARLGFSTREYEGGGYGFVTRDGIEIHIGSVTDENVATAPTTAYLYVDDADALADEWRAAGANVHTPEDTEWGQHEGVLIDLDGNIIRFGSPMTS